MKRAVFVPLGIGVLGLAATLLEAHVDPPRALLAYTAAFYAAIVVAVGALLFEMIAKTVNASWFVVFERLSGAISATLPLFLVLFVPIGLHVHGIYPWASPASLEANERAWAAHAHRWLDVPFFVARSYAYLLLWSALAWSLRRSALADDTHPAARNGARRRFVSAAGLPVMAFSLTLAAFDWLMSLNPRWASDMLGVYLFAGGFAGAMGTLAVAAWAARRAGLLPHDVRADHFHALGRVLLVSVIFWGYIAFCQFLLVWIADMERESAFYFVRSRGPWAWTAAALGVAHFGVPFFLLLSRALKRVPGRLAFVGAWVVVAHELDVYWLVVPSGLASPALVDVFPVAGVFGVVIACGMWIFHGARAVPIHDPLFAEALGYESP